MIATAIFYFPFFNYSNSSSAIAHSKSGIHPGHTAGGQRNMADKGEEKMTASRREKGGKAQAKTV